jgi:hypothetical protein
MNPSGYDNWPDFHKDGSVRLNGLARLDSRRNRVAGGTTTAAAWHRLRPLRRRLDRLNHYAQATIPVFALLFLAAALLYVLVGTAISYRASPQKLDWDEIEYWAMSGQMLAGHWDFGERRTVAYPLVIAGLRLIDGNFRWVQIGLSVIAALSPPLLYCVVRRLSGSASLGLFAGILMALWPAQLFLATSLYSETVALPCFLLFLLTLPLGSRVIRADRIWPANWQAAGGRGGALIAGLALGTCAQIRPMYLLFLPFALIIPFLEERSVRLAARTALLVALGFAVMVLPWSVWMSSRHGEVIVLTANGGETLAGGLNPRLVAMPETAKHLANRDTWVGPGKWLPPSYTGYLSPAETALPYGQMAHLLKQRTVSWITDHPADAMRIELCKLAYMWGFYPWRTDEPTKLLAGNLPILALLAITAFATMRRPGLRLGLARLWTVPLFVTGVALISWGSWRFRQPADAALLAFCVIAVGMISRREDVEVAQ